MANTDRPRGLVPVKHLNGSPWNGAFRTYLCSSTDAIYVGDIVKLAGSAGAAGAVVYGQDVEGMPTILRCTDGTGTTDTPLGVVIGISPLQPVADVNYKAADDVERLAYVVDDPTVIFEAQEDAATTPIAAGSIGLNVQFSTTAGSTVTGVSGMELVSTLVGTTTTTPLRILGLSKRIDNNLNTGGAGTDNAKFLVIFNQHVFKGVAGF
jgi:hypothetical protein